MENREDMCLLKKNPTYVEDRTLFATKLKTKVRKTILVPYLAKLSNYGKNKAVAIKRISSNYNPSYVKVESNLSFSMSNLSVKSQIISQSLKKI